MSLRTKNLPILDKDIVQANPLIEARKMMNLTEMRLFTLGLQDIVPHLRNDQDTYYDVDFHETVIPYNELIEIFGKDYSGNITNLKKQIQKASRSIIELSAENGGFGFASIYRKIKYEPSKGLVIHFNDELKPYILELVNQAYTRYKVKALFSLSSAYAWRLLESLLAMQGFLKQGRKEVYLSLTMEEIRFRLNIPDGLYKGRINNFRSRILDIPIAEINSKTDYHVWYEIQKTGRKVTGFKFWMKLKKDNIPLSSKKDYDYASKDELKKAMFAEGMTEASANTWIKNYGLDGAAASWTLATNHANKRNLDGDNRKRYIKSCMDKNIAEVNAKEEKTKKEIDDREKALEHEKARQRIQDHEAAQKLAEEMDKRESTRKSTGINAMSAETRKKFDEFMGRK